MADEHKAQAEQNATRIVEWLVENRTTFESQGVEEDALGTGVGVTGTDLAEAIDYLENREEVVRMPHGMTIPPRFLLKPGRGWPEIKDKILGKSSGA